jgi:hypothetical protein
VLLTTKVDLMKNLYYSPTVNITDNGKRIQFEGRDTIVAPVTLMVEGVHNGSSGPLLYTADELEACALYWNGMPVPVHHPVDAKGHPISCNSPEVMNSHNVGRLYNVSYSANPTPRLKGEIYVDVLKASQVNASIIDALTLNTPLEVSTGLFSIDDETPGVWNNESYTAVVKNIRPDHLALLPDQVGACSWKDGCGVRANKEQGGSMDKEKQKNFLTRALEKIQGFLTNEMSLGDKEEEVRSAIYTLDTSTKRHYVKDVFDSYVIYEECPVKMDGGGYVRETGTEKTFKQSYMFDASGEVKLVGEPLEVEKKVEYVPVVTNKDAQTKMPMTPEEMAKLSPEELAKEMQRIADEKKKPEVKKTNKEEVTMERKEKVNALIANGHFTEEDRTLLENCECSQFARFEALAAKPAVTVNAKPVTYEEMMAAAPADVKAQHAFMTNQFQIHRAGLVAKIKANESNKITDEQLAAMDVQLLEVVANSIVPVVNYAGGAGGVRPVDNELSKEAPMELPTFVEKK